MNMIELPTLRLLRIGTLVLAGAIAAPAVAAPDCSTLVRAEEFNQQLDACFVDAIRNGGKGMEHLLAEDFFYNTMRGTRMNADRLQAWLASAQNPRPELRVEESEARSIGSAVLTTGVMTGAGRSRYLHVWIRDPGHGWQLLARQVTEIPTE